MDGNKHRSLGWNWWQCKLWCSANDASSKKKHSQSEPLASALCKTPFTSSPCLFFKIKDWGWSGSWESGGPCCFTSGHNRSVVHSRSHVRALQGYKRWTRWRNCKGNPPHPVIWLANLMQDFFYWSMFESITLMCKVFINLYFVPVAKSWAWKVCWYSKTRKNLKKTETPSYSFIFAGNTFFFLLKQLFWVMFLKLKI